MNKLFSGIGLLGLSGFMMLGFAKADLSDQSMAVRALTFGLGVGLPLAGGIGLIAKSSARSQPSPHP
ncbi:MAG: hypothetical protein AAF151_23425 [Cyanobacteria bacterium J06656_5]